MRKSRQFLSVLFSMLLLTASLAVAGQSGDIKVQIKDLATGDGEVVTPYSTVKVHYTGWLIDGKKFDSSLDRGKPFSFMVGAKRVIPGWEQGLIGMKVGGKRELIIPPELGYGSKGAGGVIPANATLKFEIELLETTPAKFSNINNEQLDEKLAAGIKIIDIRRPDEWKKTGVIKGSHLLTAFDGRGRFVNSFPEELAKIAKPDDEVILICRTGNRTLSLSTALSEQVGYTHVVNVEHGITDWIKAGRPVTKDYCSEKMPC